MTAANRSVPHLLGAAFVLVTVVLWIAASFLAQSLVRPDKWGKQPQLPALLLVYICTSLFVVYLPIIHFKRTLVHSRTSSHEEGHEHAPVSSTPAKFVQCLPVAVVWFAAQYMFTVSLAETSVTSNTILSSTSSMFTLLASALVLGEKVTALKLLSVAAVMSGTAMVTLADGSGTDSSHSLAGDALVLCSALLYSCYTVMMRKQLHHDDTDTPALFFGHIGLMTALLGLPVLLGCQLFGLVDVWVLEPKAVALAGINGVMDYVLADYTWARAALLLGPTAATLGMNIQIPIATLGDLLLGHPHWQDSPAANALTVVGTVIILAGVFGINLAGEGSSARARIEEQHDTVDDLLLGPNAEEL